MKRVLILFILIFTLLYPISNVNVEAANGSEQFNDVTSFKDEISYLANLNIIQGNNDGTFRPSNPVTRLEAVLMILRQMNELDFSNIPDPHFTDLYPGQYGYNEMAKAASLGIINGKNDGSADPYGNLTRAEMAKILTKAYRLVGDFTPFSDVEASHWAYPYVGALAANHITIGYGDGTFHPNEEIKRMHFAAFLARYINPDFQPGNQTVQLLNNQTVTSSDPLLTLKEIIAKEQSVVMIVNFDENGDIITQGSGFVVGNGQILTNYHVINGAASYEIVTQDQQEIPVAGVIEYDTDYDLALLKTAQPISLEPLKIGSYEMLEKGDSVVTIGSPEGLMNTVSNGIVSGLHNFTENGKDYHFVQHTAPITHGNSGGPLFNMYGYVIGVNTFGFETGNLNFAVAIDHTADWIHQWATVPFNQIQVVPQNTLPVLTEDSSNEQDPAQEPPQPVESPAPVDSGLDIGNIVSTSVLDPSKPIIYALQDKNLLSINYKTKEIKKLTLTHQPEHLYLHGNKLYISLLEGQHSSYWWEEDQKGGVAIVNTDRFQKVDQFELKMDPFDLVADDHYLYVSSGSGQWTYIKSFDLQTKQVVSSRRIRQQSYIRMSTTMDKIYAVNTDTSPRDIEYFTIVDGQFTGGYDSPYHGDYPLSTKIDLSPDGKYLFNSAGPIFYSTGSKATNMVYATSLKESYEHIAFNLNKNEFYTSYKDEIRVYDYDTHKFKKRFFTSGQIKALFYQNNKIVYILEVIPTTGFPKNKVETINIDKI